MPGSYPHPAYLPTVSLASSQEGNSCEVVSAREVPCKASIVARIHFALSYIPHFNLFPLGATPDTGPAEAGRSSCNANAEADMPNTASRSTCAQGPARDGRGIAEQWRSALYELLVGNHSKCI